MIRARLQPCCCSHLFRSIGCYQQHVDRVIGSCAASVALGVRATLPPATGHSRFVLSFPSSSLSQKANTSVRMATTVASAGLGQITIKQHTNRLAHEESPYLLQHAHNPVDWYPWGEEAFEKARREDKPIFLSVGYSTCHWCHVMERESFESEEVAKILNDGFVSIKVDREERPDVDKVYMTYVTATSGGGGWPMTCFLTPELQPFFGGTYFPPQDAYGRPSFQTLLRKVIEAWRDQKDSIREQSGDAIAQLTEALQPSEGKQEAFTDTQAAAALDACARALLSRFDAKLGGFGPAPKFPRPSEINALLVEHVRASAGVSRVEARKTLQPALFTLQRMAAGGMHDHLGGGFHRYSVDEHWHVPHFEKMLYDNPQLAATYLAAFLLTGDLQYARVARDILDYLRRDMMHPEGGIYSAEDADSLDTAENRKTEGAFYVWPEEEIDEVLGPERASVFKPHYYVKPQGNADLSHRSDPHKEFGGKNILIQRQTTQQTAEQTGRSEEEVEQLLAESRELLHRRRSERPRPHLDDKIITAWNGMAISAFAHASRVLTHETPAVQRSFPIEGCEPKDYLQTATKIAEFAKENLYDAETGRLRRSFRTGPSPVQGFADDYAYLIAGLLDLYSAGGDTAWLTWAFELQDTMDRLFWDPAAGGYFSAAEGDASILLRLKEDYDGAEPASSSIAASNLFKLAAFCSADRCGRYKERARQTTAAFKERLEQIPLAMPQMCCALYLQAVDLLRQVIVAGPSGREDTEALLDAAEAVFAPDKVMIQIDVANQENIDFWKKNNPDAWAVVEAANLKPTDKATAFICQNFTCNAPTTDPVKVLKIMKTSHPYGGASWGIATTSPIDLSALSGKRGSPNGE